MNKCRCYQFLLIAVAVLAATLLYCLLCDSDWPVDGATIIDRPPHIRPDYTDTVIPPNIAPLNFIVKEPGTRYYVRIYSDQGKDINVHSKKPKIIIPLKAWQELLQDKQADKLYFDVYVENNDGRWKRFASITNKISRAAVDDYLVYRLIKPIYITWFDIGIYQRHLPNYDESVVLRGRSFREQRSGGCVNCHAFCNNRTDKMTIGIRGSDYGVSTLLSQNGKVSKIGTKFGYTAWHPTGRIVMYSVNKVRQFFHMTGVEVRDVVDLDSAWHTMISSRRQSRFTHNWLINLGWKPIPPGRRMGIICISAARRSCGLIAIKCRQKTSKKYATILCESAMILTRIAGACLKQFFPPARQAKVLCCPEFRRTVDF